MLRIIEGRNEVGKTGSGQLIYRFGMILKCRLKPSQVASVVRFLAELDHRIVTTVAITND
jgi:hypothetical protein